MSDAAPYADTWVVLPTYDEAENLEGIAAAILAKLPGATLLVVDDSSPDGTGELAERMAAADAHVRVRHRAAKQGLGKAYIDGFGVAMQEGAARIVQMDADWSHSPDYLPALLAALAGGPGTPRSGGADLAIGSRYVAGGGVLDWGIGRKIVSRGGSIFARTVLRLKPHDLTGGFKAWRREALEAIEWRRVHSGGYVFQIETTYLASRAGARVVEVPIVFTDRRVGVSKMSRRIIGEALQVVLQLRWEELRGRGPRRASALPTTATAAAAPPAAATSAAAPPAAATSAAAPPAAATSAAAPPAAATSAAAPPAAATSAAAPPAAATSAAAPPAAATSAAAPPAAATSAAAPPAAATSAAAPPAAATSAAAPPAAATSAAAPPAAATSAAAPPAAATSAAAPPAAAAPAATSAASVAPAPLPEASAAETD